MAGLSEAQVQEALATYIRIKYPKVIFHSDFGSGAKLTVGQARKQKRQNAGMRGFPDLQICQPIDRWNGFFLEIKKEGVCVVLKNGKLTSREHIREQASMIERLRSVGYWADFGIGYEDCRQKVDAYMRGRANAKTWTRWDS